MSVRRIRGPAYYPLSPCFSLSPSVYCVSAPLSLKNERVIESVTYSWQTGIAADACWHLIELLMQHTKAEAPIQFGCFPSQPTALCVSLKGHRNTWWGPGESITLLENPIRWWTSILDMTMMSLAPSYVFKFFFFDVCRLFVYRSSGRDVLDCLKFRINTILRVCQTENGVSFRSDVTALKSCKDKSGFKLALQRKLSRGHDQVKMFSFS